MRTSVGSQPQIADLVRKPAPNPQRAAQDAVSCDPGTPRLCVGGFGGTVPQYFWWLPGFARIARAGYLHPWSAPTQAVKAGRRPPEGEAVTARSAGAATMDWEARQGLLLAGRPRHPGPAPQPVAAVARPLRRRGRRRALQADGELQLPARPGSAPQSGRDPFHIGIWAGIVSESETDPAQIRVPWLRFARQDPARTGRTRRTERAVQRSPPRSPTSSTTPPCVQERPATVPQLRPRPIWALPKGTRQPHAAHGWGPTQSRGEPSRFRPQSGGRMREVAPEPQPAADVFIEHVVTRLTHPVHALHPPLV